MSLRKSKRLNIQRPRARAFGRDGNSGCRNDADFVTTQAASALNGCGAVRCGIADFP